MEFRRQPNLTLIYNPERMEQEWGGTDITWDESEQHLNMAWMAWTDLIDYRDMASDKRRMVNPHDVYRIMRDLGYDVGFDYQVRLPFIKFAGPDVKAAFLLTGALVTE